MEILLDELKKINLQEGDILILPDIFSSEYRQVIQRELSIVYSNKKVGVIYVPNPNDVRILKVNALNN
jgi:hypothetical protein